MPEFSNSSGEPTPPSPTVRPPTPAGNHVATSGEAEAAVPGEVPSGWKRRAVQRRLYRGRRAGEAPVDSDFEPVFRNLNEQDGSLTFELAESQLTGRVLPVPGPEARWRAHAAVFLGSTLTVALAAAALHFMWHAGKAIDGNTAEEVYGPPSPARQLMQEVRQQASSVPLAREAVEGFFKATTPAEKAAFVRGGEAMLPAMLDYYARRPDEPAGFRLRPGVDFGNEEGREFIFIHGTSGDNRPVETVVEITPGGLKLDWRFLTGMGQMEWSTWLRERPHRQTVMRVEAALDDYYAAPFSDSREWLCLRITDAEHTSAVWAYTPRISPTGLTLFRQMNERRGPVRFTGTFEFPSAAPAPGSLTAPQVHLCRVASQGWLDQSAEATGTRDFFTTLLSNPTHP